MSSSPSPPPVVNPALFRLRVFEDEWLESLAGEIERAGSEEERWLPLVLLKEAERWYELGRRLGYFPSQASLRGFSPPSLSLPEALLPLLKSIQNSDSPTSALQLSHSLILAQEELTPERREYLYLLYFATDSVWEQRLAELQVASEDVSLSLLQGEGLSQLSWWALFGAQSELDPETAGPAAWRAGAAPAQLTERSAQRAEALNQVMAKLEAACQNALLSETNSTRPPTLPAR